MNSPSLYPVPSTLAERAQLDYSRYQSIYQQSVTHPDAFWAEQSRRLDWMNPWHTVKDTSFSGDVHIRWFLGGQLNVSANCLDRHLAERGDKTAILWESDDGSEIRPISYRELHREVCRLANALKILGVERGHRVTIYMPMIPEAAFAMLACARIGAIHSVVFGGFSADSLRGRMEDSKSNLVITADEGLRGGKTVPLKANVDKALEGYQHPCSVLVYRRTGGAIDWKEGRDIWYHDVCANVSDDCPAEPMDSEDPLFILYTSGSTGKPKGIVHTTGGYLLYAAYTHATVFDLREDDIYWCTADVGWITGHSYIVYGPLANGATTLMFEGVPSYPSPSRFWEMVDRHKVTLFYTAPTAIRALMREGNQHLQGTSRESLRVLGSVGEPINPEAWLWYHHEVGKGRCHVVDTWWQTETGGFLISPIAGTTAVKPGSATLPLPGVQPVIADYEGKVQMGEAEGLLCIADSWPGQARTLYGDHERFVLTYFTQVPGMYFTGDGCRRDADGYYWITGRVDDVLNVSGHRIGTAEVESALVAHPKVAEAAVVGYPHDIKGQGIYVYVTLNPNVEESEALKQELRQWVRGQIGPIASPDIIQFASGLPKTRSGKIMRRILRKIAENDYGNLGDTSTLLNPESVEELIRHRNIAA
jgi:acetyl-CoA synthetase